jgi:hypothetical protein
MCLAFIASLWPSIELLVNHRTALMESLRVGNNRMWFEFDKQSWKGGKPRF